MPVSSADSGAPARAGVRLNRFLARSGVASRRRSDELIRSGAVRINGAVVDEPGCTVDPASDRVEYAGREVRLPGTFEYVMLHKPLDCLVTKRDTRGRRTVYDVVDSLRGGTVAVGRLDRDTTGLLLLTDDGELAFRLMHPRFGVDKVYRATVAGQPVPESLERLRQGIELDDGPTAPARVRLLQARPRQHGCETTLELCIHEGRKRQVRRMLRAIGHPVRALARVGFGGLALDVAEPGRWRHLTAAEVSGLASQVGLGREATAL